MKASWPVLLSVAVHAAVGVAVLVAPPAEQAPQPLEQGMALIWGEQAPGLGDAVDADASFGSVAPPGDVPAPPSVTAPPAPAAVAAVPMPPVVPSVAPPVAVAMAPPPPVPPPSMPPPMPMMAAVPAPAEQPPPETAEAAPPPEPAPPQPVAPQRPQLAARQLQPAPATPRARPAAEPGPVAAAAGPAASPALATGGGEARGAVTAPRPLAGGSNPAPEYPYASRMRGEQGRVTLRVEVDQAGRVVDAAVERSAGFRALDQAALRAVRNWRFQPAARDGQPVVAIAAVDISFRLEGDRRW